MSLHPKTKSRPALPFWYRLTQVVLEKRLLAAVMLALHYNSSSFYGIYIIIDLYNKPKNQEMLCLYFRLRWKTYAAFSWGNLSYWTTPLFFPPVVPKLYIHLKVSGHLLSVSSLLGRYLCSFIVNSFCQHRSLTEVVAIYLAVTSACTSPGSWN